MQGIGTSSHDPPIELSVFVGRGSELLQLERLLPTVRLITLTGAGGSGKTRLARELATRVTSAFADGVAWVELAALSDPDLLPGQIAASLGIAEQAGAAAVDTLAGALGERELLLVLDNCEHLADACASLTDRLLRTCRRLTLIATSREALGVAGERAWLVPPLAVPDPAAAPSPAHLAAYEAVELFVVRAQDVLPSFHLTEANARVVARICHRLDGLPLAIELAAARVKVLTPEQLIQRLDNVFAVLTSTQRMALPRHRTLRATFDWSYHLLGAREQLLLQRLSVFAGGCTIDAVEAVCAGGDIESADVLDLLAGLVDRSLVVMREQSGYAHYSLLEIVRQYAQERRTADGAADHAARERHAGYFLERAEDVLSELERNSSGASVAALRVEQENLRAALHWSLTARSDLAIAVRLVAALWRYWFHSNQWNEGASWCEAAIAVVPGRTASQEWVRVLNGAGVFAYLARDAALCRTRLEEAEAMSRSLGDEQLLALTLYRLAHLSCDLGEHEEALARAEEAVRLARAAAVPWVLAEVLVYALAFVHRIQGRAELADRAFAEAETIARHADARMALTEAHMGRALLALQSGDAAEAMHHASGAAEAARTLADDWYLSRALLLAAGAAVRSGDAERAALLLGRGAALRDAAGTQVFPHEQDFYHDVVRETTHALGEEGYVRQRANGTTMPDADVIAMLKQMTGGVQHMTSTAPAALDASSAAHSTTAADSTAASRASAASETTLSTAPALRVRALGPLEIHRDGELVPAAAWRYAKPKELLLFLMLHPTGRTRDEIARAIWPGASLTQAKNSFHVTMHHLRKTLGHGDWIVLDSDRYRLDPADGAELDADVFERTARRLLKSATRTLHELQHALALYRGELLGDEVTGPWVEEHRDRLRRLAVELNLALGAALEDSGDHAAAAELYHALVTREDLNEEAHRRLMHAWARAGQRPRALRHYDRLVALLREELDAEPEAETADLYDSLRRSDAAPDAQRSS